MTEADRIRSMSDEAIAQFLCDIVIDANDGECTSHCPVWDKCYYGHNGFLDELTKPVKEG